MKCRADLFAILFFAAAAAAAPPPEEGAQPPAIEQSASSDFRAKAHEYKSAVEGFHKPAGEITAYCDKTEWQNGLTHCTGNVRLTSDTMELRGDVLDVDMVDGRVRHARITGEPARMIDNGGDGQQPIAAQANKLDFDPATNIVELAGSAQLMRNGDRLTGELIRYDVSARRVQAAGGSGNQVKIVIQPPAKSATQP